MQLNQAGKDELGFRKEKTVMTNTRLTFIGHLLLFLIVITTLMLTQY